MCVRLVRIRDMYFECLNLLNVCEDDISRETDPEILLYFRLIYHNCMIATHGMTSSAGLTSLT